MTKTTTSTNSTANRPACNDKEATLESIYKQLETLIDCVEKLEAEVVADCRSGLSV